MMSDIGGFAVCLFSVLFFLVSLLNHQAIDNMMVASLYKHRPKIIRTVSVNADDTFTHKT